MAQVRQTRKIEGDGQTLVNLQYELRCERDQYADEALRADIAAAEHDSETAKKKARAVTSERKAGTPVAVIGKRIDGKQTIADSEAQAAIERAKSKHAGRKFDATVQDINLVEALIRRNWNEAHR